MSQRCFLNALLSERLDRRTRLTLLLYRLCKVALGGFGFRGRLGFERGAYIW